MPVLQLFMASRVLVAFDESSQSTAALIHAAETFPDTDFHILTVVDPGEWSGAEAGAIYYAEEAFEQAKEMADERLADAESIVADYDIDATTAREVGRPSGAIVDYAEEHDIDHIVLGSHGRTGLARFLLGSVAERVARRSPTSVTIVRERDD